jgi:hypothetical protein
LEEGIVGLQVVRFDGGGIGFGVAGDDGLDRLPETACEAALVCKRLDVAGAIRTRAKGGSDGSRDVLLAVGGRQAL